MSKVKDFLFPFSSTDKKQPSERIQRFYFNGSEVKQGSEHSQRYHLNITKVKKLSGCSQILHFNDSDEVKHCSEHCQIFSFSCQ